MIVVSVGTDEHREVERRMTDQLAADRAAFYPRYGKYLPREESQDDNRDAAA